jgi:beta-lactamase regulating signal transducer with metallopeptidase domain
MQTLLEIGLSNALLACVPAVLAVAVSLTCRRPALVHALWLLVLVKLVTPPLLRIPLPWPAPAGVAESDAPVLGEQPEEEESVVEAPTERTAEPGPERLPEPAVEDEPAPAVAPQAEPADVAPEVEAVPEAVEPADVPGWFGWPEAIALAWLAGSLGWFVLAGHRLRRFSRAIGQARPAPADLATRVDKLARAVGLRRAPETRLVPGRLSLMVWGLARPVLLVPESLLERLHDAALDTLLVHELAHLARRDHWVRVLEFFALGLCWWNPLAWFARRELHEAEEQCCDAWVPRVLPGAARTYAAALVDVLDFLSEARPSLPPLACGVGQLHDLKRRLTMIMRGTTPHALGRFAGLTVIGLALLLLPLVPGLGHGQDNTPKGPAPKSGDTREMPRDAGLARARDELKRKLAEVEVLKRKIDLIKRAEELRRATTKAAAAPAGVSIRIEINVQPNTPHAEIVALVKDLEKALGGKDRKVLITVGRRPTGGMGGAVIRPGTRPPAGARPGEMLPVPRTPANVKLPARSRELDTRSAGGLEKKVEALLRELEALRRELRDLKSRPPTPPAGPLPPGAPAPAPKQP